MSESPHPPQSPESPQSPQSPRPNDPSTSSHPCECPFRDDCWRFSYSKYLEDHGEYPGQVPPSRMELFTLGYASFEMAEVSETKRGKKRYGGIFANILPVPWDDRTPCPDLDNRGYQSCDEYQKERRRIDRIEEAGRKKYGDKNYKYKNRKYITRGEKLAVWQQCKFRCQYCLRHHSHLKNLQIPLEIDHIIPLRRGGQEVYENLTLSCRDCNRKKGSDIWDFGCMRGKVSYKEDTSWEDIEKK